MSVDGAERPVHTHFSDVSAVIYPSRLLKQLCGAAHTGVQHSLDP